MSVLILRASVYWEHPSWRTPNSAKSPHSCVALHIPLASTARSMVLSLYDFSYVVKSWRLFVLFLFFIPLFPPRSVKASNLQHRTLPAAQRCMPMRAQSGFNVSVSPCCPKRQALPWRLLHPIFTSQSPLYIPTMIYPSTSLSTPLASELCREVLEEHARCLYKLISFQISKLIYIRASTSSETSLVISWNTNTNDI